MFILFMLIWGCSGNDLQTSEGSSTETSNAAQRGMMMSKVNIINAMQLNFGQQQCIYPVAVRQ
jgi:hypothetical protein